MFLAMSPSAQAVEFGSQDKSVILPNQLPPIMLTDHAWTNIIYVVGCTVIA